MNLLLGSKSPRRKELLDAMGIRFKLVDLNVEESYSETLRAEKVAEFLAEKKAKSYLKLIKDEILLTADTTVVVDQTILNKPNNESEAVSMLEKLSDKTHQVITGICVRSLNQIVKRSVTTRVTFRKLQKDEIIHYVKTFKPYDKAGAYGIQEWIGHVGVKSLEGSYNNVVGLPTYDVYEILTKRFNFSP